MAPMPITDHVLRAMTDDGAFRVMTMRATDTVQAIVDAQRAAGMPAAQLGEVVCGAVLVRETMAPPYRVQILLRDAADNQIVGDAFPEGRTRGLVRVDDDALGVQLANGGYLQVMRSMPGRAPHQGIVAVAPGCFDEALIEYFRQSEQVETMAAVTAVLDGDRVAAAGGFVVQLLPEVTEPPLQAMRRRLRDVSDLGRRLEQSDADPQQLLDVLLAGVDYTELADSTVEFGCHCGREKAVGSVSVLGDDEVRSLLAEGKPVRVTCDYCNSVYEVGVDDFRRILAGEVR